MDSSYNYVRLYEKIHFQEFEDIYSSKYFKSLNSSDFQLIKIKSSLGYSTNPDLDKRWNEFQSEKIKYLFPTKEISCQFDEAICKLYLKNSKRFRKYQKGESKIFLVYKTNLKIVDYSHFIKFTIKKWLEIVNFYGRLTEIRKTLFINITTIFRGWPIHY